MQQLQQQHRLTARRSPFLGGRMGLIDEGTINDLQAFHSSHKCHRTSMVCDYRQPSAETPTTSGGKLLTTLTGIGSWPRDLTSACAGRDSTRCGILTDSTAPSWRLPGRSSRTI
ncbi:probable G-protein coupled receptor CG31760 [Drosophila suzukii]|uniref:Probable G-protein coupled receptor CG31760 n=1 Tax=Drosophila suzukii TaxID=28584 RepID=A0ABM4TW64_DROSZ